MNKIPAGYKKTEVGIIPEDWVIKSLGDVLKIKHGKSQKDVSDKNGSYPILASGGVIGMANKFIYNKPSVLIGRKGTIDAPQYMETPFWSVDTLFYSEIFDGNYPRFLFYKFLLVDWYAHNEASGVPSLNAKTIEQIPVSMPPTRAEQTAIATALNDADALITQLEKLIAKKRLIKQGAMQQLLTGKKRLAGFDRHPDGRPKGHKQTALGSIPEDWEIRPLKSLLIGKLQNGVFFKPSKKGSGIRMINVGDLYTSIPINLDSLDLFAATPEEEKTFGVSDGDVFFTRSSVVPSGIAHCNIFSSQIDLKVVFDSHLIKARPDRKIIDPQFLFRYCSFSARKYLVSHAKTAIMTTIDQRVIERCPIIMPSTLGEQVALSTALSDMDTELDALEAKLAKYKQIKQGMMQTLLTGKVRLI